MALPEPECGLVISYSYLWRHESDAGRTEGVKDRPCAIVLAIEGQDKQAKTVTVAPITHTPPSDPLLAIEIPPKVKQHLGLDAKRSWIILDKFNEFTWPGFDLRPVPGNSSRYDYGFLPPALLSVSSSAFWSCVAWDELPPLYATRHDICRDEINTQAAFAPNGLEM